MVVAGGVSGGVVMGLTLRPLRRGHSAGTQPSASTTRSTGGLRARLVILILLTLGPVFALNFAHGVLIRTQAGLDVRAETLRAAGLVQAQVARSLATTRQLLLVLAEVPAVRDFDPETCDALLAPILRTDQILANLAVLTPDGDTVCSGLPMSAPVNAADRLWFQRTLAAHGFAVGDFQIGRITGKPGLNAGYPVHARDGTVQGVVMAAIDLTWLGELLADSELPAGSVLTVVDGAGTILVREPDLEPWVGASFPDASIVRTVIEQQAGTIETTGIDGIQRLYGFTALGPTDSLGSGAASVPDADRGAVFAFVGVPSAIAYADADEALVRTLGVLLVIGLVALLAAWVGSERLLLRPIGALMATTTRLRTGDLSARSGLHHGPSELGRLGAAFEGMAVSLKQTHDLRETAEATLRASEQRYRSLVEQAADAILVLTIDSSVVEANAAACLMLGYGPEEMVGLTIEDLAAPAGLAAEPFPTDQLLAGRIVVIKRHLKRKDGVLLSVESRSRLLPDGRHVLSIVRDVTEQERAEAERVRLVTALEQSADAVLMTDASGTISYLNPAMERLSGYARDELQGQNPRLLKSGRHDASFYREMWAALVAGEVWTATITDRRKDGSLFEADSVISPVRDADGVLVGYLQLIRDVTDRRALEAILRQAQKMESVGHLAGGIAHDFNNLLGAIIGYAELVLDDMDEDDPSREDVAAIGEAGHRAASLTGQLLAFSRRQVLEPTVLDPSALVTGIVPLLQHLLGEDVTILTELAPEPLSVRADPGQLEQVLVNLVVNARDAMPEGGTLTLATAEFTPELALLEAHPEMTPGRYVRLTARDTGSGMDAATLGRIFEPFFTTKEPGRGTGLGLASVYGIVKQSDGYIYATSEPGAGTTLSIYLPWHDEPAEATIPPPASAATETAPGGTETVLLVEDELALRELARRVLEQRGYRVLLAADATEALGLAETFAGPIDLLVSDVVLPDLSGPQLAERLTAAHPGLCVLFVSGYAEPDDDRTEPGDHPFLAKPYTHDALARAVHEALG